MKMNEQNFMKLVDKVNTGKLACKILTILLTLSMSFNLVLSLDIVKLRSELDYQHTIVPVIEKQAQDEIISLTDVTDQLPTLPAIPTNLK